MRYGRPIGPQRSFSWKHDIGQYGSAVASPPRLSCLSLYVRWIFLPNSLEHLNAHNHEHAGLAFSVPPLVITPTRRYRNIDLLCIDYCLRPRLSSRLTLGGRTLPRKPYPYGDADFNRIYRYLCPDTHFQPVHARLPLALQSCWNAFLPLGLSPREGADQIHNFGTSLEPRSFSARINSMGQLLRFV